MISKYFKSMFYDGLFKNYYTTSGRTIKKLTKIGYWQSLRETEGKIPSSEKYPVDFVVTWVDCSDKEWRIGLSVPAAYLKAVVL